MTDGPPYSLEQKLKIILRDIYEAAILKHSLVLEEYRPSQQLEAIFSEEEYKSLIEYLRKQSLLKMAYPASIWLIHDKSKFKPYKLIVNQEKVRKFLGYDDAPGSPQKGVRLDPTEAVLRVNGAEIKLGKGRLHKSLQYWVCWCCLKEPNAPVEETDIMAKYDTDYEITARGRAVRDAVYRLNPKIKAATGIDNLFTYSVGYVKFNADKVNQ
jgi:hypothetical protein